MATDNDAEEEVAGEDPVVGIAARQRHVDIFHPDPVVR